MGEVLVVDDNDDIRELIAMRVEHAGHHVTSIGEPRRALEAAAGASGYLSKPFTMGDLDAQVAEVLALGSRVGDGPGVLDGLASA